jgi:hypothetical protein
MQQLFLPNVRKQARCKRMHKNMVQQYSCGDSRVRLSGRAKLDWLLIFAMVGQPDWASWPKDSRGRLPPHEPWHEP